MRACEEVPLPSELDEHWAFLLLAASRYWLRRRLINGRIFTQQARITPEFWKKKVINDQQLRCEHEDTQRSENRRGSFIHCRACGMRLMSFAVDEQNQTQARKRHNEYRKKLGTTGWLEWAQQKPKKPTEPELNTEGRSTAGTSPTSTMWGSASSSRSTLEQTLIAMMMSQQEGTQPLSSARR